MISEEEMRKASHKKARIVYLNGTVREGFIESFEQAESEEEEPMILYAPNKAAFQSELESIEII